MMKFPRFITLALAVLIFLGFAYILSRNNFGKPIVAGANTSSITVKVPAKNFREIVAYTPDMTALDATKLAVNSEMVMSSTEIIEILGVPADRLKRQYWELLINGESALMNAGSLKLSPGDEIEWKLSKF